MLQYIQIHLKGIRMNHKIKLKYGTPLMVLSIVIMIFSALAALALLFLRDIMVGLFPEDTATEGFDLLFNAAAIVVLVIGVLILVAGVQARYSKGWSIFLLIIAGLSALFAVIEFEVFTLLLYGSVAVLAALNIKDANDRAKANPALQTGASSLEQSLSNLNDLFDRGLITQAEYDKSREDILSKF